MNKGEVKVKYEEESSTGEQKVLVFYRVRINVNTLSGLTGDKDRVLQLMFMMLQVTS